MKERYQLRCAMGKYWLLDMEQERFCYKPPVTLNDTGYFIWKELSGGSTKEQLVQAFSQKYGISEGEAWEDVMVFLGQLKKQGIQVSCMTGKRADDSAGYQ